MTLQKFDAGLRRACRRRAEDTLDERTRPFVCTTSDPRDVRVFIVGINPAREIDWWNGGCWNAETGFIYNRFLELYGPDLSRSRQVINCFVNGCAAYPVLETNVYAVPSPDFSLLGGPDRRAEAFLYLLDELKPRAVVVHGKPARKEAIKALCIEDPTPHNGQLTPLAKPRPWGRPLVTFRRHFSRGWGYDAAERFGQDVATAVANWREFDVSS